MAAPAEALRLLQEFQPCLLVFGPLFSHQTCAAVRDSGLPVLGHSGSARTNCLIWHVPSHHALDMAALAASFALCWVLWQGQRAPAQIAR